MVAIQAKRLFKFGLCRPRFAKTKEAKASHKAAMNFISLIQILFKYEEIRK
ncbi:hypothetical protein D3C76_1689930 [compost metagenome]